MSIILILLVLIFVIVLMAMEIPKILSNKSNNELFTFLALLMSGAILQILKILKVDIPNPSDAVKWFYSPITELIKNYLK